MELKSTLSKGSDAEAHKGVLQEELETTHLRKIHSRGDEE